MRKRKVLRPITKRRGVDAAVAKRRGRGTKKPTKQRKRSPRRMDMGDVLTPLLRGPIPERFRDGENFHVSDIIHKCTRKLAIHRRFKLPHAQEAIFDGRGLTFTIGDAVHDYIRNKIRIAAPSAIYGGWSCKCGETTVDGTYAEVKDIVCNNCNLPLTEYQEVELAVPHLMVEGHVDLTFLDDDAFLFTELKSIAAKSWAELERPIPDHIVQIVTYWELARILDYPVHDKVSILYANKEFSFKSPYKEYVLQPSEHLGRIDGHFEDLQMLVEAVTDERAPLPYRICANPEAPDAKKCEVCNVCFNAD